MIVGIGTDVCSIERIAAAVQRHGDRFAQRVLGPDEWRVYEARRARVAKRGMSYLATRFAAKEAFSKAIGMGMRMPMTWRACQVINAPSGKPEIRLNGELARWFDERGWRAHVSVSDEAAVATAFVVIEKDNPA
jgi:holo-[acyl-carrier-protein] synthase